MAKVRDNGNGTFSFFCPGCGHDHVYYVNGPYFNGAQWSFNGDLNNPTFSPSLLNRWGKEVDPNWQEPEGIPSSEHSWSGRCHLFVRNGKIEYCNDCTHKLAGKTIDMQGI